MAGRGSTFNKRQKEQRRLEKREEKSARRLMRKQQKESGEPGVDGAAEPASEQELSESQAEIAPLREQENHV